MLFITGDVHHRSLNTRDQSCLDRTEVELAKKYVDIAARYDVPVTLFVSGKTVREDPNRVARLTARNHVEIGGHNWSCFEWSSLHFLSELLLDSHYGPVPYQRWDVHKTLGAIEDQTGIRPRTWRSHAFVEDNHTPSILADAGIEVVSNVVGPESQITTPADGLLSLPINTLPDHSHVYHGWLSEEYVSRQTHIRREGPTEILSLGRAPTSDELVRAGKESIKAVLGSRRRSSFQQEWYTADEWVGHLEAQINTMLAKRGFVTVLAHPACMELADGMDAFERLCSFACEYETRLVSEATALATAEGTDD